MKPHGEAIDDSRVVEKVLRSLSPKFESLDVTLEENKDLSQFTIDELQASLINHKHRISRSNTSLGGTFAAQSSISHGRGWGRSNYGGRGRSFSRGGHNKSLANVIDRGQNQNPIHPSGHRFDK